ncbi:uncharacterized protein B0I36DRAFT_60135 [Microdochium trichocladiopsis]|uniref:Heterokaryon incompatibility domain-containing protein n=1 Tax=Microdochium trichocladiopsis TaxID=1682393 RepID=A0A9P8XPQ6_9PEZI|nr:uncharacterized protein B0I36DRAFT_60135 [Microdochium trichocladiopsis]KAH7009458.1 hypothetical protein B0I36DRAFT_60135 [Microdochium trichocladiopsis]
MIINSVEVTITCNLYHPLFMMSRNMKTVYFWVDAVSIHQDDNDEKGSQISLMEAFWSLCMPSSAHEGVQHCSSESDAVIHRTVESDSGSLAACLSHRAPLVTRPRSRSNGPGDSEAVTSKMAGQR